MIITLTQKFYTKQIETERTQHKRFKNPFLGSLGGYVTEDIVWYKPLYDEFETKLIHINSCDIKELIESEHHTLVVTNNNVMNSKIGWSYFVVESVDDIKKQFK